MEEIPKRRGRKATKKFFMPPMDLEKMTDEQIIGRIRELVNLGNKNDCIRIVGMKNLVIEVFQGRKTTKRVMPIIKRYYWQPGTLPLYSKYTIDVYKEILNNLQTLRLVNLVNTLYPTDADPDNPNKFDPTKFHAHKYHDEKGYTRE